MSPRRYILLFVATLSVLAAGVTAFDRVIDPFWYYRDISIEGLNVIKTEFRSYERLVKPSIVQREQPASLVFGSSFLEIGIDPLHPALKGAGKSYNFALAGASWDMVVCGVQFALKHDHALRQIVVGIHPLPMPRKDCSADIEKMENPEERAFLFSSDAFQASIRTIAEQRTQRPSHTAEGQFFGGRGFPGTEKRFRGYISKVKPCTVHQVAVDPVEPKPADAPARLDLTGLHDLVRKTTEMGLMVKLVVYPRHALLFEQEYQCGMRQARWDALAQIVSEVNAAGGKNVEVWDFEGYHAIGTEPISDAPEAYWQDAGHFNYEMGNIMLDEMFGLRPPVLGQRLEPANILLRAQAERKARMAYLRAHPDFLSRMESLLPNRGH